MLWVHKALKKIGIETRTYRHYRMVEFSRKFLAQQARVVGDYESHLEFMEKLQRVKLGDGLPVAPWRKKHLVEAGIEGSWNSKIDRYTMPTRAAYQVFGVTLMLENREYSYQELSDMADAEKARLRGETK